MSRATPLTDREVKSAFRYRADLQTMMADPDLTGDTLLLAVGMLNCTRLAHEAGDASIIGFDAVCEDLGWTGKPYQLRSALHDDIPRYEVDGRDRTHSLTCGAPMIRRDGICDKPVQPSLIMADRDPQTGTGRMVGFCSRHGTLQHDVRARTKAWHANGSPEPPHNAGGVLSRYFSGLEAAYTWANYGRATTPGDGKPAATPAPPRPVLTLIPGGRA